MLTLVCVYVKTVNVIQALQLIVLAVFGAVD